MQEGAGPRPFDVSINYLIELDARAWLDWIHLPADGPVISMETDAATVLAEVDKVLRVDGPTPWLAHIETQSSRDARLPSRLLQYHALLHHRYQIPVETAVVLLRPEADGPELTGRYDLRGKSGVQTLTFSFRVIRLWERPATELLTGGLGVVPLAPLAAMDPAQLHQVVRQLDERLAHEASRTTADELLRATLLLLRLRYDEEEIAALERDMVTLRDSPAWHDFLEATRAQARARAHAEGVAEGELTAARQMLLSIGAAKLGPPDAVTLRTVNSIEDVATLQGLAPGVLSASSWQELLAERDDH